MRKRYIQDRFTGEMIDADQYFCEKVAQSQNFVHIMPDIQPYQSQIDGSMITSRSKHREHLKKHGCMEVGNEVKHLKPYGSYAPPSGRKEEIIRIVNEKLKG